MIQRSLCIVPCLAVAEKIATFRNAAVQVRSAMGIAFPCDMPTDCHAWYGLEGQRIEVS